MQGFSHTDGSGRREANALSALEAFLKTGEAVIQLVYSADHQIEFRVRRLLQITHAGLQTTHARVERQEQDAIEHYVEDDRQSYCQIELLVSHSNSSFLAYQNASPPEKATELLKSHGGTAQRLGT